MFRWLKYLSFFYYAFEALMVNELKGPFSTWTPSEPLNVAASLTLDMLITFNPTGFNAILLNGNVILDNYGLKREHFDRNIGILFAMCFALFIAAYVLLHLLVREKR